MELKDNLKKKRGRPKKESCPINYLDQAKLVHPKETMDESLVLPNQNPDEKCLLTDKMITVPQKKGRAKKAKFMFPKKKLFEDDVPTFFQLEEEYNPFKGITMEGMKVVPNVIQLNLAQRNQAQIEDPAQLSISEEVAESRNEEPSKEVNDNFSLNCTSSLLLCCSVRLKRLTEDEIQKYQNCRLDVEKPVEEKSEKEYLLENLGNFLRYKGSSTRGNFLNVHNLNSSNSRSFKFSDDSTDEDYLPESQKFPSDDLDWNPGVKCVKRKSTKRFPAKSKVKNAKRAKADQVSNYLSADNLSRMSTDSLSSGTRSFHLNSDGNLIHSYPEANVNANETSDCSPTNLTCVSKKNLSRISPIKSKPQSMLESESTQSLSDLIVKQGNSQANTCQKKVIDLNSSKESSTRGNFLNVHDLNSSNSRSFKFSDDSTDEDYLPESQKFPSDDLDWNPGVKCVKRKSTKSFPAKSKVKNAKRVEADQVSNYLSADNLSRMSTDNLSSGTRSFHLDSDGNLIHSYPEANVNANETSDCSPTNLTRVSKKNLSRISPMKRKPQSMLELESTQSLSDLIVKQENSQANTCQKKAIVIINIASDSGPEDESMKTLTTHSLSKGDNFAINKTVEITPIKLESNLSSFKAEECQSTLKTKRKRTKRQVSRNSSCAPEKVLQGSEKSKKVTLKKRDNHLKSKNNCAKSPSRRLKQRSYSKRKAPQTSGSSTNALAETIVASRNSSLQIEPMTNHSQPLLKPNVAQVPQNANVQRKPPKCDVFQKSNCISNNITANISDISKYSILQNRPKKEDSKSTILNNKKYPNISDIQRKLQSVLKQRNWPIIQVPQACGVPLNRFTGASGIGDFLTASMVQDSQSVTEMLDLPSNTSQASDSAFPDRLKKLNVIFSQDNINSFIIRNEKEVENSSIHNISHAFDESVMHCNSLSSNLDGENASITNVSECTYCKYFVAFDAIAALAVADLDENPKAFIEKQIESTEAMYKKLKVTQTQDVEADLNLKRIAQKNRGLKCGRFFLSSFGSFINVSDYLLKSIDLEIAWRKAGVDQLPF